MAYLPSLRLLIFTIYIYKVCAYPNQVQDDTGTVREEILDFNGKYILVWDKDFTDERITFNVTVETTGFIGFGISPNGGMDGADIVIGGVYENGDVYFSDRYSVGYSEPEVDVSQDWELLYAWGNDSHTGLSFTRLFDTCDEQDIKIGNDTSNLIWSFGSTDTIAYHGTNRGSFSVNLLDPVMPPLDESAGLWRMSIDFEMPQNDTTYWCTIHKSPNLPTKHHAIGFEPYFPTEVAKTHTHHFIVHECHAPDGVDLGPIMEPIMETQGGHCYRPGQISTVLGQYCQTYLFVWAVGGRRTVFPDHVGYPITEGPKPDYYMFEIHYNNPGELSLPKFETGIDIFYTSKIRQYEAGTLTIGHDVSHSLILPPRVVSFMTVGHCSSTCTNNFPTDGLKVFNVLLHSHLAGRKLKIRHYRDGKELPWMSNDENYNFDFQQNRPLKDEAIILPGDQFSYECIYDTTKRDHVTIGGFASEEEMCQTFIAYYPKMETRFCGSSTNANNILRYVGIESVENSRGESDPIVIAPPHHAGKRFTDVANELDWTVEKVAELQHMERFIEHRGICSGIQLPAFNTTYLNVPVDYFPFPPNTCNSTDPPTTPSNALMNSFTITSLVLPLLLSLLVNTTL